jgi:hypothetical protein
MNKRKGGDKKHKYSSKGQGENCQLFVGGVSPKIDKSKYRETSEHPMSTMFFSP